MSNDLFSTNRNVLLVEGLGDLNFVWHLRMMLAPELRFDIENKKRLSRLLDAIYGEIVVGSRDVVGIMIDADDSIELNWEKVVQRLVESGIQVPSKLESSGVIIEPTPDRPRVGVWIMPDNNSSGELENFVIDMIDDEDTVWPISKMYVDGIPTSERKFAEGKTDRAKLYAWLATRRQPPHIGAAIGAGDLNLQTDGCNLFVDWLKRLFVAESQEAT